jgi:cysteine-rich repeat protein
MHRSGSPAPGRGLVDIGEQRQAAASRRGLRVACVAWCVWLGACSDGGTGQEGVRADVGHDGTFGLSFRSTDLGGSGDDASHADVPAKPCEAGKPCACVSETDCPTACIETPAGSACDDACPEGTLCSPVYTGADTTYACLPRWARLCEPCNASSDCNASLGGENARCVSYGGIEGSFCGAGCKVDLDCPGGYRCGAATTSEGESSPQCVRKPDEKGRIACPCDARAIEAALTTGCSADTASGACAGKRKCTDQGLGDCTASDEEQCDGLDNDCNGLTDDKVCDDGKACTDDFCVVGTKSCAHAFNDEACSDGDPCTLQGICDAGGCVGTATLNCDDGNPCTADGCLSGKGCSHKPMPGQACTDGNPCTVGDACDAGQCVPGAAKACGDGNPCTDEACDPAVGTCVVNFNSALCDDGNACTDGDSCNLGTCEGSAIGCDDKNVCTTDNCQPLAGCVHKPNNLPCDDGNLCTDYDECELGKCTGDTSGTGCDDGNPCTTDVCAPAGVGGKPNSGGCVHLNNAGPCDDGSACTAGDVCQAGQCVSGTSICACASDADCKPKEDGNLCNGTLYCDKTGSSWTCKVNPATLVTCDTGGAMPCAKNTCAPSTGVCGFVAVDEGKPCDADGSLCTLGDHCQAGACIAGATLSCDDGNPCTVDGCKPTGGCVFATSTAPCSDGNPCTLGDACKQGACMPGVGVACDDGNVCTTDACSGGGCVHGPSNLPCDDGNACSISDLCKQDVCAGKPADCDDGNPCTNDTCDSKSGCVHTASNLPCDDGNPCTSGDACQGGGCKGAALQGNACDDGNPCTTDACNSKLGCVHAFNSLPCDDGNGCTTGDTCGGGVCQSGTSTCGCSKDADCATQEDGNLCNGTLFCDKTSANWACKVNPKTVVTCDTETGSPCMTRLCDAKAGKCVLQPTGEGKACDADGSVCTSGDACKQGECEPGSAVACDDGNVCSDDVCDAKLGCVHKANTAPCSDGNACTLGDGCQNSACVPGKPAQCQDGNPCTTDGCDTKTGACGWSWNVLPCDDGNACSDKDLCDPGNGVGTAVACDDGNPCTADACSPKGGCSHAANNLPCDDGNACTGADTCTGGKCLGTVGLPQPCDDGNACTTDACSPSIGCTHAANAASCDDGNPCTVGDTCASGKCGAGTNTCGCSTDADCGAQEDGNLCNGTLFCDKSGSSWQCKVNPKTVVKCDASGDNVCAKNVCAASTGQCGFVAATDGKTCDADASACTQGDACQGGVCQAGPKVSCDDGNPCSDDGCDAKLGCTHLANAGPCNDGSACTLGDKCASFACQPGVPVVCSDGNACTTDACDVKTGTCSFAPNTLPCDDGNACSDKDACQAGSCSGAGVDCDDGNPCTADSCSPKSGCVHQANNIPCSDGSACTTGDTCQGGVCKGVQASCDDGNPCTSDTCDPKLGCAHTASTASCDDGNGCTVGDVCQGGACIAGKNTCGCSSDGDCAAQEDGNLCNGTLYCDKGSLPYACKVSPKTVVFCDSSGDDLCAQNTCDPKAGKCAPVAMHQGLACDADGSACTSGDKCDQGVCVAGGQLGCNDGNPCTDDSCDNKLGCVYGYSSAPCSDGNACTLGDKCNSGACKAGVTVGCDDGNPCTNDGCDAKTGNCDHVANNLPCDDGNACSDPDVCQAGACSSKAVSCDDKNVCTSDSCDPKAGCVHAANNLPCDDGSVCTGSDTCAAGGCKGKAMDSAVVCDDANPCTSDGCSAAVGCVHVPQTATCDDGNPCTVGDVCVSGQCGAGTNKCSCSTNADCAAQEDGNLCNGTLVCDKSSSAWSCKVDPATVVTCDAEAAGPCAKAACEPGTGKCTATALSDGTACDADSSVCTVGDVCTGGTCQAGSTLPCNDGNPCTLDHCDAKIGCMHDPAAIPCNDDNPCTVGDLCKASACAPGAAKDCGDGNPCTNDGCDTASGSCTHLAGSSACDDGSACTQGDTCLGGSCVGKAVVCDDKNPCTNDSCSASSGCAHVANLGACDDDNPCTVQDACQGGNCVGSGKLGCDDGNPCTTDVCNAPGGCSHISNTGACDDGNACTISDTCAKQVCVGKNGLCDDGNPCTTDACNVSSGCVFTPNSQACDDGNPCTTPDVCSGGACKGVVVAPGKLCDDNNVCTTEACDQIGGCSHLPTAGKCDDNNSCTTVDSCSGGVCFGSSNVCNCKTAADCATLEDGNLCNGTLICDQGQCKVNAATVVTCAKPAYPACSTVSCVPATGQCASSAINDGMPCDADGNVCTAGDTCSGGTCKAGAILGCSDGNACTVDACDAKAGCTHVAGSGPCSDGNGCTVGDQCAGGACTAGVPTNCDDGNVCTNDACDFASGKCYFAPIATGTSCDADGSVCTTGDACKLGTCLAGSTLGCDDGNVCTTDTCDAKTGCVHAGNYAPCNDGNICTGPDSCSGGTCAPPPLNCNDDNPCTKDTCDKIEGCVHTAVSNQTQCGPTGVCSSGGCIPGKCGDGVLQLALGEQCDDGNLTAGDGCNALCEKEDPGCADGKRDGMLDYETFPKIALCNGPWSGYIGGTQANALCGKGYHVCGTTDILLVQSIPKFLGTEPGCWAINAVGDKCNTCPNDTNKHSMAGIGGSCKDKPGKNSCMTSDWGVQAGDHCSRTTTAPQPWIQGVACCANQ